MSAKKKISEPQVGQLQSDLKANERALEQPRDSQVWRSFSKDVEFLAMCLRGVARPAKCCSMKAVHFYILHLVDLTRRLGPLLTEHGLIFVAVRRGDDFVRIEHRSYQSAHHAALGEANVFLQRLRDCLHPTYWMQDTFDPAVIIENWDCTRNAIPNQMPTRWQERFEDVIDRVRRERAAIAEKMQFPSRHSHVQVPYLPVVNLALNQIRFDGECYDVTAEGARMVHCLVNAWPEWFATSKNGFSKPSETKESLPRPIRELIETKKGTGYRLKIE